MLHSEIEPYFETIEKTNELIALHEAFFIDIDEIDERLRNGEVNDREEIDALIGKLSGLANKCEIVAELADSNKKGQEGILETAKIQQCDSKPNMSQISREVSHEVQFIRRVRDIFRAYTKRADRALGGCQSRLKKKDRIRNSEEDNG